MQLYPIKKIVFINNAAITAILIFFFFTKKLNKHYRGNDFIKEIGQNRS